MTPPSEYMARVREAVPLVHHITNYVTVNDCANVCICAGGSPVMTDYYVDVAEMVRLASASVLNIGTLNEDTVRGMFAAAETAAEVGAPVVVDPVGAGATCYRTRVARDLIARRPAVIKGNAGEIGVLAGTGGEVRGVDSGGAADPCAAVRALAERTGAVVVATGAVDYVSDGMGTLALRNGSALLERISGSGCMLSSVVGCYVGACGASVESVAAAITAFNVASQLAEGRCSGPGTFKPALLDALSSLDGATLDSMQVVERLERLDHREQPRLPREGRGPRVPQGP